MAHRFFTVSSVATTEQSSTLTEFLVMASGGIWACLYLLSNHAIETESKDREYGEDEDGAENGEDGEMSMAIHLLSDQG